MNVTICAKKCHKGVLDICPFFSFLISWRKETKIHPHITFRTCLSIWNSICTFCFPAKYINEQRTMDDGRAWRNCGSHFSLLCSTEAEKLRIGWNRLMSKMPSRHFSHHNIAKLMILSHPYGFQIDYRHFSYPIRLLFI